MWPTSPDRPSDMSMSASTHSCSTRQHASLMRGIGRAKASRASGDGSSPCRHACTAAALAPRRPVTQISSPASAPFRKTGQEVRPRTTMSSTRGPGERERSPPRIDAPWARPASATPACTASRSTPSESGTAMDAKSPSGVAAMAARSESAVTAARYPISRSESQLRRKCTSSTHKSVLRTHPPSMTAASSPGPTRTAAGSSPPDAIAARIQSNSAPGPSRTVRGG